MKTDSRMPEIEPAAKMDLFNLDRGKLQTFQEREARSPVGIIPLLERYFGRQPVRILEIGVFQGGLTKAFAASSLNIAEYEGVDPYLGSSDDHYTGIYWDDTSGAEAVYRKTQTIFAGHGYKLHRMTSCQYFEHHPRSENKFHIIYVDGDHRFHQAFWDMCSFTEMLADGGVMLVDDYANIDTPDVTRAVNTFLASHIQCVDKIGYYVQPFQNRGKYIPISQTTVCFTLNKAPLPKSNNEPTFLLRALVRDRVQRLALMDGIERIAIFGAGKHTQWLETSLEGITQPTVMAILDDKPDSTKTFFGRTPEKAADYHAETVDAILLSTDCLQEFMAARCRELYGPGVKLINLYGDLPPGPYEKR